MTNKYYPNLSSVLSAGDLPQYLSFFEGPVDVLLSKAYYRNLKFAPSIDNSIASIDVELLIFNQLELNIPGTGLKIVADDGYHF